LEDREGNDRRLLWPEDSELTELVKTLRPGAAFTGLHPELIAGSN
jgi:hypothetical protein